MSTGITAALVFLLGTVVGALVKSIFEMWIRSALERRAKKKAKAKRKLKKRRKELIAKTRFAVKQNP